MRARLSRPVPPAAALLLLALAATGCGLFSTRAPTPPFGGSGELAPSFVVPESTLATLQRSVHDRNTANYLLCLADTASADAREFHATFDPVDATAYTQSSGHPPGDWNRSDEASFFPQFLAFLTTSRYDVFLFVDTERGGIIDVGGPTQKKIYNMHYRVWAGSTPVCAGSAGFSLERLGAAGEFRITYWEDRQDTVNVRTWGAARLNGR